MTTSRPTGPSGSPLVGRGNADRHAAVTRSLLGYGLVAGPLYVVSALVQGLVRDGFDLARDDVSLLANGPFGWVQIATFVVCGLMTAAAGVGVTRALRTLRDRRPWSGWLVVGYGIGLALAGVFVADPMNGFPPGTPDGPPAVVSVGGIGHVVVAGLGFLCLVGACFAVPAGRPWFGRVAGVLFLVAFVGVSSGNSAPVVVIGFWIAVILAWTWLALTSLDLYRRTPLLTPAG
ncbi:DUF998 domain-containing protein [Actinomycetospora chiangmaiensis]|uniref:DUF998 domain-containing protein n=1 Tax=Actinomycetospora chiangmaiensis TaxID=402650 RepID=UPI00037BC15C|nr:DUF998 domain-containing protein [Actinomycetospora chiangmaiensis]